MSRDKGVATAMIARKTMKNIITTRYFDFISFHLNLFYIDCLKDLIIKTVID